MLPSAPRRRHVLPPALAAPPARRTNPRQHSATLIHGQPFGLDEFVLEGLKLVIVQAELHFEGAIGHAPLALQQCRHLGKDGIKSSTDPSALPAPGAQSMVAPQYIASMALSRRGVKPTSEYVQGIDQLQSRRA